MNTPVSTFCMFCAASGKSVYGSSVARIGICEDCAARALQKFLEYDEDPCAARVAARDAMKSGDHYIDSVFADKSIMRNRDNNNCR